MAAYFGKPRMLNRLLVKTEESVIYKKQEKLQKLTKDGMECYFEFPLTDGFPLCPIL
jgi:hypothetical protein